MGYFSNGTEGAMYEEEYCDRCVHQDANGKGCAVWLAHLLYSYRDCNDDDSILHLLIPRSDDGLGNERCLMFKECAHVTDNDELALANEYLDRRQTSEALVHLSRALGADWEAIDA